MVYRIEPINQYLWGWMGYFGISKLYGPIPELDGWLRRRTRIMIRSTVAQTKDAHQQPAQPGNAEATCLFDWLKQPAFSTGLSRKGD
jgi:RNA-directed DNA polymerase